MELADRRSLPNANADDAVVGMDQAGTETPIPGPNGVPELENALLLHFPLSPASRKVRFMLYEKGLYLPMVEEPFWQRRRTFMRLNPAGELPVLQFSADRALSDGQVICEFLEELRFGPNLLGADVFDRAEVRRIVAWFDSKFYTEVGGYLLGEKLHKRLGKCGAPDSQAIRVALKNLSLHLDYIGYLVERRNWLAGPHFSLADITAAAHISCLDYFGDVAWQGNEAAKSWYARLKSRPTFRPFLHDHVDGIAPARHYANLDF